jgi:DNA-binding transcriptional regulator YdaS (Cro superfamily)
MATTVQSRTLQRAAEVLGGTEPLAARLGVSQPIVRAWISGSVRPPEKHFFLVVDILRESGHGLT